MEMHLTGKPRGRIAVVLGALVVMAALGAAAGSMASSGTARTASVSLRATKLGKVLVAPNGHSLYLFRKDTSGKSSCSGTCATYWPPLLVHGKPIAGAGVKASLLGTTKRSNGSLQVTYAKHPLYTFSLDKKAGQMNGQGSSNFGARWFLVSASGAAIVKAAPTTGAPATTTTPAGTTPPTTTTSEPGYP
jgi:predicted lipoprotein with Yx(FWY)xxD motif